MRFSNARQCIHDAFATNLTTPDRAAKGGTRYNSNNAIAHQAEAGLIIRAALEQPAYLRATCLLFNAPDGVITETEVADMKKRLWADFVRSSEYSPRAQGEIVAILDRLLLQYRRRCQDPLSTLYTGKDLAALLRQQEYTQTLAGRVNRLNDILMQYDIDSLQPVWAVVNEQREKYQNERADNATA